MNPISFQPIGTIYSSFEKPEGTPIQFSGAKNSSGEIEIFPQFTDGLKDLNGFSHLILLFHFHLMKKPSLIVKPFMDDAEHGIFATRSPARPNPIGFSIVRLKEIKNNRLFIEDVDIVNGTPLLDIKPYVPEFDAVNAERTGWLEKNAHKHTIIKDDGRFIK